MRLPLPNAGSLWICATVCTYRRTARFGSQRQRLTHQQHRGADQMGVSPEYVQGSQISRDQRRCGDAGRWPPSEQSDTETWTSRAASLPHVFPDVRIIAGGPIAPDGLGCESADSRPEGVRVPSRSAMSRHAEPEATGRHPRGRGDQRPPSGGQAVELYLREQIILPAGRTRNIQA